MPIYRFRILDETKHVIAGQYSHCNDDDAARRHAEILAAQTRNPNIVIWDDDRQVFREHVALVAKRRPAKKARSLRARQG